MEGGHLVSPPKGRRHKEDATPDHVSITVALDQTTQHKQTAIPKMSPKEVAHDLKLSVSFLIYSILLLTNTYPELILAIELIKLRITSINFT